MHRSSRVLEEKLADGAIGVLPDDLDGIDVFGRLDGQCLVNVCVRYVVRRALLRGLLLLELPLFLQLFPCSLGRDDGLPGTGRHALMLALLLVLSLPWRKRANLRASLSANPRSRARRTLMASAPLPICRPPTSRAKMT